MADDLPMWMNGKDIVRFINKKYRKFSYGKLMTRGETMFRSRLDENGCRTWHVQSVVEFYEAMDDVELRLKEEAAIAGNGPHSRLTRRKKSPRLHGRSRG